MDKTTKDTDRLIRTIETMQARYAGGEMNRRTLLQGLFALGLSSTAVALVMSDKSVAYAAEGGPAEVLWDGKPFDAGGETVTIAHWGGEMEDFARKGIIDKFETDFNCKVVYDSNAPWFSKMSLAGPDNPPIDLYNGNLPEAINLEARGFFTSRDELKANVPSLADMWPDIAFYGPGVIWALHVMGIAYRTDVITTPPNSLAELWNKKYENTRAIYGPINDLQAILFMSVSKIWGKDQYDMQTGFDKFVEGKPWIISPFTGETMNLMERGEVEIAWQTDGEALLQKERGLPIDWVAAKEVSPFNQMHSAVSKGSSPMKKKLAYALLEQYCSPAGQTMWSDALYFHPINLKATISPKMTQLGYKGTADDFAGLFMPDWRWYISNQSQIVDTLNAIFSS